MVIFVTVVIISVFVLSIFGNVSKLFKVPAKEVPALGIALVLNVFCLIGVIWLVTLI